MQNKDLIQELIYLYDRKRLVKIYFYYKYFNIRKQSSIFTLLGATPITNSAKIIFYRYEIKSIS